MTRLSIPLTLCTALLALVALPAQPEQVPLGGEVASALSTALDDWMAETSTAAAGQR